MPRARGTRISEAELIRMDKMFYISMIETVC